MSLLPFLFVKLEVETVWVKHAYCDTHIQAMMDHSESSFNNNQIQSETDKIFKNEIENVIFF